MSGDNGELLEDNPKVVQGETKKIEEKEIIPTEFKIAEIWIRKGIIHLDAAESFWQDKIRALGLMEYIKDIIKQYQPPKEDKKIIRGNGIMDFVRHGFKGKNKRK